MKSILLAQSALSLFATALAFAGGVATELTAQCAPRISMNFNMTHQRWFTNGITQIAIQANAGAQTQVICSAELYMSARSGSSTLSVSIYDAKGPQGGGKLLATGSVAVSTLTQVYKVYFSPSAVVPANQTFWIVFSDPRKFFWPVASSGTVVPHYRQLNNAWTFVNKLRWNYRISSGRATKAAYVAYGTGCPTAKAPLLSSAGRPVLGSNFAMELSNAKPSSPVVFILGVSDKLWDRVIPLPFDLKVLGAPGCFLRSSTEVLLATATDKLGRVSVTLPIPNNTNFDGGLFYTQFLVVDLSLSLAISNGGKATMGTLRIGGSKRVFAVGANMAGIESDMVTALWRVSPGESSGSMGDSGACVRTGGAKRRFGSV